jgi:SAM-dependent methyltransferase
LRLYGQPQFFKHYLNIYTWNKKPENCAFAARGIYARENMISDCVVLDLCCGDGSISYYFFSDIALKIDAVDNNELAIKFAKKYNLRENINYLQMNILNENLPIKLYDVIVFNAAMLYFTLTEIDMVFKKIILAGKENFTFCGMVPINPEYVDHKIKFFDETEVLNFLSIYFNRVEIKSQFEGKILTIYFKANIPSFIK